MQNMPKKTSIHIEIDLDKENVPAGIRWKASDGPQGPEAHDAKGMLLAFFDAQNLETFKIDLWTKDMQVIEMDRFFFQTLRALADTYYRATQNADLANDMQRFVQYFGQKIEIIPPDK